MIASDQKRLVVDAFARYRIYDPLKFYQTVNSIEGDNSRLSTLIISSLRRVLGKSSFIKVVRDERPQLTGRMREQVDREAAGMGITVLDLRIRSADLPDQNSQAVYQRMETERQREAAEFRALGNERAQRFARALIATSRSCRKRRTPNPNRFAAMAMLTAIPFSPQPLIAIGISLLSTERSRPIRRALLQKTRECC